MTHQHAARFAILLGSCAVVLAVLAVSAVFRSRRHRSEPAAAGLGLLVVGLLAGTLAAMQLQVDSVLTGLHSQVHFQAGFGDPVRGDLHTLVGPSPHLALAALICAGLAAAASIASAVRSPRLPPQRPIP